MTTQKNADLNKPYIMGVSALTVLLPLSSYGAETLYFTHEPGFSWVILGKWFIFYAVGFRLLLAGIRQTTQPAFTAVQIFKMQGTEAYPVIRELGFANLCFGLLGIISLFIPAWRVVSALGSGLYYGLAGLQHGLKKPAGINEQFALYTDVVMFIALLIFFIASV